MLLGMPVSLLTTATIWANAVVASRGNIHIPLNHNQGAINATEHAAQVSSRYLGVSGSSGLRKSPTSLNAGFWYGTFGVGDSQNLSLLIDTGSSDVGVDTAKYEPGPASMNLHISGNHSYATAFANGCGEVNVSYHGYADRVSHAGLWVKNQHLYHIAKETPPNKQTLTEIPHDGIVGFAGNTTKYSFLGGLPYLQNLCKESLVEECRFGLAFDTSGTGKEILGGIETDMIEGEMTVVETEGHTQWSGTGTVTAKGSPIFENATVIFDTGTAGVSLSCYCLHVFLLRADTVIDRWTGGAGTHSFRASRHSSCRTGSRRLRSGRVWLLPVRFASRDGLSVRRGS